MSAVAAGGAGIMRATAAGAWGLRAPTPLLAEDPHVKAYPAGITKVYLDLDGVLADFDSAVRYVTGRSPGEMAPKEMWRQLAAVRAPGFFAQLPPMPDAAELYSFLAPYSPIILSGIPLGSWAPPQKLQWVRATLGKKVSLITCFARDKQKYARKGAILIDDNADRAAEWTSKGGLFILHTNAADTLEQLRELGFS